MFTNRSFQKAILFLTILSLFAGTLASTYIQKALVVAGNRISTNHLELSTLSHKVRPGEEEEPVQAGLPPCSATSGNCKLGTGGAVSLGNQMAILIHFPVSPGEQMATTTYYCRRCSCCI